MVPRTVSLHCLSAALSLCSQGGHDVPDDKLLSRFERIQANLRRAAARLPHVLIFDNSDLACPYRHVATHRSGKLIRGEAE